MRTAETTAEIRSLTDAELDAVNGASVALGLWTAVLVGAMCAVAIGTDLLPGELEEAKKALGMPQTDTLKPLPT